MERGNIMTDNHNPGLGKVNKVAVLILGMHRSGTSMLGGVLDQLGCQGPKSLLQATGDNPKGYFESSKVMALNDDILNALGSRWDDWQAFDPGWQDSPRFVEFRARMTDVLATEYGNASLIYLKDPRLCRLLPLWREVLVDVGYTPMCIHTHRNPADVSRSLACRKTSHVEPELGMLLWLRHILDAEVASRGLPRIFTSYTRILNNWNQFSDMAEEAFGFSWPVPRNMRDARLRDMVDPALRHHDSSVGSLVASSSTPDPIRNCLRVMEEWAESGEDDAGRKVLTQIADQFDMSAALFRDSVVGLSTRCKILRKQEAAFEAKISDLNAKNVLLQKQTDFISRETAIREELLAANKANAQLQDVNARTEAALRDSRRLNDEMRADTDQRVKVLEDELTTWADRIIARDKVAIQLKKELAALQKSKKAQEANLKAELAALRGTAEKRAAALNAERKLGKERLESLHQEYRASTSWKISAPIRVVGGWLKR